ncbi:hypothetical protein ABE237_21390 [Brevibacillus formosus]|uniref:hypothetical protein n=1 Tax=Brevibacillus formosus TaxID=54913 RepID=UPI0018CF656E|nr:hypothetical protein [Brevibacillus formosus]MBG9941013.1 hypothetical protein [Brevibacillus formosus]
MIEILKDDLVAFQTNSRTIKLDWTNFLVMEWDYVGEFTYQFQVTPEDYLLFAKQSLQDRSTNGLIDAMSNAKRAIECQIDSLISLLGYDYKSFDKRTAYPKTKNFISNFFNEENTDGITDRIKLLQILNITPSFLISKIRSLRNKVEHEYIIPDPKDVKEAIEIAELFINSSMRRTSWINRMFFFGSNYNEEVKTRCDGSTYHSINLNPRYMCIELVHLMGKFFIKITIVKNNNHIVPYDSQEESNESFLVDIECEIYPVILLIFFTKQYNYLLNIFNIQIEKNHIKYKVQET